MSAPEHCPRFERCGANICPLDADWEGRVHLAGEPVCGLLMESVKPGGEARLRGYIAGELVNQVLGQRGAISARWYDVKRRLERSALAGSKLVQAQRLRGVRPLPDPRSPRLRELRKPF